MHMRCMSFATCMSAQEAGRRGTFEGKRGTQYPVRSRLAYAMSEGRKHIPGGYHRVGFLRHKFRAQFVQCFQDLHRYTLGCAFAHLYHARGFD